MSESPYGKSQQKPGVVIIGAGHGGVQAAASLREEGYEGAVTLISDDKHAPYQRPPLSKAFLKGQASAESLILRGPGFYADRVVDLLSGVAATSLDRAVRIVRLSTGEVLAYDHLILATGAVSRAAPFPGMDLHGVLQLRNLDDAIRLKERLAVAHNCVVIGAGFIGLEFAATAAAAGKNVTVVEAAPRVMGRAVSPGLSDFFAAAHQAFGVRLHLGVTVEAIEGRDGCVKSVLLGDGRELPADCVLVGIGVLPQEQLAAEAGLQIANGIVVNSVMTTSDPAISAVGDCALHPSVFSQHPLRLESVQNAGDQARVVARKLTGKSAHYDALPWFWSDQGDLKLQIAGLIAQADRFVVRGDEASRSFSIFAFRGDNLQAVESVNRPADHMAARKILASRIPLSPEEAGDPAFALKLRATGK